MVLNWFRVVNDNFDFAISKPKIEILFVAVNHGLRGIYSENKRKKIARLSHKVFHTNIILLVESLL